MESLQRFFRRMKYSYKRVSVLNDWKTFVLVQMMSPIMQMLCFSLVGYYVYGQAHIVKWMIGNAVLVVSFTAIYGVGAQLFVEKTNGTLSLIVASKTTLFEVLLTSAISSMLNSLISVSAGLISISLLLKITWELDTIVSIGLVLMVATFVAMAFGFLVSCFILVSKEIYLALNMLEKILLILTGANFPLSQLPEFMQYVSYALPLTRSIAVAQAIMEGENVGAYLTLLTWEVGLGMFFLSMGALVLQIMEKRAIKRGVLDIL